MASFSNSFVPFTSEERTQMAPLSGSVSVPIRAPLTQYDDDDDDGDFDVSTNATLSDTASHSDASETPSATVTPFVADSESDLTSEEDQEDELSPTQGAPLRVTPVAHLSTYDDDGDSEMDDEDDDEESELDGDDELPSVLRVPQNSFNAPRIKVPDVEEEEEEEEQENDRTLVSMNSLPVSQSLLSDEFSNFSFFNDVFSENSSIEPEDDIDNSVGIGLGDDDGDFLGGRVGYDECSIASNSDVMLQYSPDNSYNEQFGKVRVVLDELEEGEPYDINRNERISGKMFESDDSIMQKKLEVDIEEATHKVNGISVMVGYNSLLKSNAEDYSDGRMPKQNLKSVHDLQEQDLQPQSGFSMTGEPVSEAFAETVEYGATQRSVANGSQGFAFAKETECEELVSMTKYVINSKSELHDSSASFESTDDACEDKQIQSIESSEMLAPTLLQENACFENDLFKADLGFSQQDDLFCDCCSNEYVKTGLNLGSTVDKEAAVELYTVSQESKGDGSASDGVADSEGLMPIAVEQFKEQISALFILLGSKGSGKNFQQEQLISSSLENMILTRSDAKGQLTVACGGESDGRTVTFTSADESSAVFLKDPGSFSSLLHGKAQAEFDHNVSEKEKENIERIQDLSVKFLRLVLRVKLSLEDSFVSKVLCRLVADIGRRSNQELVIKSAKVLAKKLEEDCQNDLDFSLNILVLGKSGVGKSATINSIFGDMKVTTNAFEPATTSIKEVSGTIDGIKVRILDTPGLMSPMKDQAFNRKILSSIRRYMKKFPVDVILYVDRVDSQVIDLNDLPMLKSITNSLSPSIWQRSVLTLTHAASTPLDGPSGSPLSYDRLVAQKSYLVQQSIARAVHNLQLRPGFMCPVSLVENNPLCGEFVLPSGLRWRSQLLALCISLKILNEVSSESGPHTLFDQWKHFFLQNDTPPLSHTFSSLLQSHAHLKFKANWN